MSRPDVFPVMKAGAELKPRPQSRGKLYIYATTAAKQLHGTAQAPFALHDVVLHGPDPGSPGVSIRSGESKVRARATTRGGVSRPAASHSRPAPQSRHVSRARS